MSTYCASYYQKVLSVILFFGIVPFVFPRTAEAAVRTVCLTGCQYTTVSAALTASAAGDEIRVGPGTYAGFTIDKQVTIVSEDFNVADVRANPVKIVGQVVINGNWAWDQGPVIQGFNITHSAHAVVGNAPYTLEYSYVHDNGSDGASFETGSGGILRGNYFENPSDDCIDVDNQSKNILIENNTLSNCGQDGIEIRQQDVSIPSRVLLTFRNNSINGTGEDGMQIMDYNNTSLRYYIVARNLIMNTGKAGVGIMSADITNENYSAAAMPEALYVVNNTFLNNDAGISGGANAVVLNNIFSGSTAFDLKSVGGNSVIKNNVFAATPKLQGTNNLDQSTTKTGAVNLNSSFIPQAGSVAIDAGIANYSHSYSTYTDTVVSLTSSDYSGSAPDSGWKESAMTTASPTPTSPLPTPTSGACGPTGDIDCSGEVNVFDLSRLLANYGTTNQTADIDHSGEVNLIDLSILLSNYGRRIAGTGPPATPTLVIGTATPLPPTPTTIATATTTPSVSPAPDPSFACLGLPGPVETLTGAYSAKLEPGIQANKKFDARGATFVHPGTYSWHQVGLRGSAADSMCWAGGYFTFDTSWHPLNTSWDASKHSGGFQNFTTVDAWTNHMTWTGLHVYNVHDGIRTSDSDNNWAIQHVWLDYVRDDCIENDHIYSGTVYDSLFDGCYVGVSTRPSSTWSAAGQTVTMDKMLIRMEPMPYPYQWDTRNDPVVTVAGYTEPFGYGNVFKVETGNVPDFKITNSVFLLEYDSGKMLFPDPANVTVCSNNTVIWMGNPAQAPTSILTNYPGCFTLITDKVQGKALWKEKVSDWHRRHPGVGANRKPTNPGEYHWPRY